MTPEHKGTPEGATTLIPRLICRDVEAQIQFCCEVLGAVERVRRPGQDGKPVHAMLMFGSSMLMLEAESPSLPSRAPKPDGSSPVVIYLYVEDVDASIDRARNCGATVLVPVENRFWRSHRMGSGSLGTRVDSRNACGGDNGTPTARALVGQIILQQVLGYRISFNL